MPEKPFEHYVQELRTADHYEENEAMGKKINAIRSLGKFGKKAGPVLTKMLDDHFYSVYIEAAKALGEMKYEPAIPKLVEKATGTIDGSATKTIAKKLAQMSDKSLPLLLEVLKEHPVAHQRAFAAIALGCFKPEEAMKPLIEVLHDPREERGIEAPNMVIAEALTALGKLGQEEAIEDIAPFIHDAKGEISGQAIKAIEDIGGPKAMQALMRAHEETDMEFDREAIEIAIKKLEKGRKEDA